MAQDNCPGSVQDRVNFYNSQEGAWPGHHRLFYSTSHHFWGWGKGSLQGQDVAGLHSEHLHVNRLPLLYTFVAKLLLLVFIFLPQCCL